MNFYYVFKDSDFYNDEYRDNYGRKIKSKAWVNIVLWCGIIVTLFIIVFGIEKYLDLFIPKKWGGYDEDGDWQKLSYSIAAFLGLPLTVMIYIIVGKYLSLKDEVKYLENENERLKKLLDK